MPRDQRSRCRRSFRRGERLDCPLVVRLGGGWGFERLPLDFEGPRPQGFSFPRVGLRRSTGSGWKPVLSLGARGCTVEVVIVGRAARLPGILEPDLEEPVDAAASTLNPGNSRPLPRGDLGCGRSHSDTFESTAIGCFLVPSCPGLPMCDPRDEMKGGVALRAAECEIAIHPYLFRTVCTERSHHGARDRDATGRELRLSTARRGDRRVARGRAHLLRRKRCLRRLPKKFG